MKRRFWLWLSISFLVLLCVALGYAYAPDRSLDSLRERWASPPSEFVEIGGLSVHLRDQGPRSGALPILLLHGTSASLHTWEGWVAPLAQTRRVISVDLPGFGLTGPAPDSDYHIARYVAFVAAVLDHFGIERAVLAGNSLGGEIAWRSAVRHPDRVAALILVDAAGYAFTPKSIPIGFQLARNAWLSPLVRWLTPRPMVAASVRNTYGDPRRVSADAIERYYELTLRAGNRAALIERFAQMELGESAAAIAHINVPTLILWGGRDALIPIDNAQHFHRDIRGSELTVFEDLGHIPQEEDPARTVAAAESFLSTHAL